MRLYFICPNEMAWTSHTHAARHRPIFRKSRRKLVDLTRKINSTPQKTTLQIKSLVILITLMIALVNQSHFEAIGSLSGYMWKFIKVWQKSVPPRGVILSKLLKISYSNFIQKSQKIFSRFLEMSRLYFLICLRN